MTKLFAADLSMRNLRHSRSTAEKVHQSVRKIASGERITRAGDDAAGLSISTKVASKIRSRYQAMRNANDAIGFVQVMEGAMDEMGNMVTRMRELAIAAASDTYSAHEREMMDLELTHSLNEIRRISSSTELFGSDLLNGDNKTLEFQVDVKNQKADRIKFDLRDYAQSPLAIGIHDIHVDTQHRARTALIKLDFAQNSLSESRARLGAISNRLQSSINNLDVSQENAEQANSRIKDADYAQETATSVASNLKSQIQAQAGSIINNGAQHLLKLVS